MKDEWETISTKSARIRRGDVVKFGTREGVVINTMGVADYVRVLSDREARRFVAQMKQRGPGWEDRFWYLEVDTGSGLYGVESAEVSSVIRARDHEVS